MTSSPFFWSLPIIYTYLWSQGYSRGVLPTNKQWFYASAYHNGIAQLLALPTLNMYLLLLKVSARKEREWTKDQEASLLPHLESALHIVFWRVFSCFVLFFHEIVLVAWILDNPTFMRKSKSTFILPISLPLY